MRKPGFFIPVSNYFPLHASLEHETLLPLATFPDIDLVLRLRNGDVSAGGLLYERNKRKLYFFVLSLVKEEAAAEDIVQQTFMTMLQKIGTLGDPAGFRTWLYSVARNEALMVLRRRRIVPMEGLENAEETVLDPETPATVAEASDLRTHVHAAVHCLKPEYREIVLLQMIDQLSYDEIAAVTGSTVSSVRSKLHKARIALAKELTPLMGKERPC